MFDILHQNVLQKLDKAHEETERMYTSFTEESYKAMLEEAVALTECRGDAYDMQLVDGELVVSGPPSFAPPDATLTHGSVLVESAHSVFPENLLGTEIEEIDENITEPTFVVIAKRLKTKYIHRFSATKAFYILTPWNPIRRCAVYITTNQFFDYLVILTILINCVFLAISDPPESSEYVFLGIYTLEMIIKLLARGFFVTKYTYLRDPWNWLDFIVIIMAYISVILQKTSSNQNLGNMTGLRTFRVLRALKTVSIIPGLKTIVNALLRAFKMLFEVITLTLFCLMVFALFGLQVYMGTLRQKCVLNLPFFNSSNTTINFDEYFQDFLKNETHWLTDKDGNYVLCGNSFGAGKCPSGYTCRSDVGENPNFGYSSFDNFGWAMLSCFQMITLDFWEDLYNKILRTSGPAHVIFFLLIVLFGSFYLINLMLAVVAMSYEEEAESAGKESDRQKAANKKLPNMYDVSRMHLSAKQFAKQIRKSSAERVANENQRSSNLLKPPSNHIVNRQRNMNRPLSIERNHNLNMTEPRNEGLYNKSNPEVKIAYGQPIQTKNPSKPLTKNQSKDSGYSTRSFNNCQNILDNTDGHNENGNSRATVQPAQTEADNIQPIVVNPINTHSARIAPRKDSRVANQIVIITALDENMENSTLPNCLIDRNCSCCKNCCCYFKHWLRLQNKMFSIVSNLAFEMLVIFCIILNTGLMAAEHHDMPTAWKDILRISNYIFTAIFTVEAIFKIIAFSKMYFKNGWNIFDLIVVIASLVDLGAEGIENLSVFRTFRLLRVFKLAQSWPTMRLLLTIIINTLGALANLTLILVIVIYIFAVIGMQLFRHKYTADKFDGGEIPRWNFNDFPHSFMMVFRVLCGEWIEPLWDCMRAADEICMVVFLPTLVFGNFMVLNLFLAMLLNSFASDSLRKDEADVSKFKLAWNKLKAGCFKVFCCCISKKLKNRDMSLDEAESSDINCTKNSGPDVKTGIEMSKVENWSCNSTTEIDGQHIHYKELHKNKDAIISESGEIENAPTTTETAAGTASDEQEKNDSHVYDCFPDAISNRFCKWYDSNSEISQRWYKFRKFMCKLVDHKIFETIVLIVIAASSITLAFEDVNLESNKMIMNILRISNFVFAVLFSLEMLLKWFAYGFKKYFTSFWTILDFFIVVVSITTLLAEQLNFEDLSAFRSLRTLRALRPLRAISRWQGMRIVVNALLLAIPSIFNVLLVCLVFWLIFSIMGVQFFSGKFRKCMDANNERLNASIVPNYNVCMSYKHLNYTWVNSKINFDDILHGYLALFQVATFEGWIEVMVDAIDATGIDLQPKRENNFYMYLYFVSFIVFGSFFTLNLFIGVIIDNFNMLKKKYEGSYLDAFLTANQKTYYNTLKKLSNKKPQKTIKRPKNKLMSCMYDISLSTNFELIIVVIIFLNMITLAIEHYKHSAQYQDALDILNVVFTTIFSLEMIVKILGLRWHYFRLPWNVFDFIVVILSIIGVVLADVLENLFITPTFLRVIRVFRIGRVLRLIKAAKGIRKLLFALIISLPALFNIGALLFLIMYIYAIIGMSSFGRLKLSGIFDDMVNFRTFPNSIILLFRLMTSAGWNDILDPMMISPPNCNDTHWTTPDGVVLEDTNGDCGVSWLAVLYMVSYIIIIFLIVINMYIAVILENFSQAHEQEEVGITDDDFDMFYTIWERYDGMATQFISYNQLSDFIGDLEAPLGIPKPNEIAIVSFNIPIVSCDKLHCLDILKALVKNVLGDVDETKEFKEIQKQMDRKFEQTFPTRVKTVVESSTLERKRREVAARTIQRSWRYYTVHNSLSGVTTITLDKQNSSVNNNNKSHMSSKLNIALSSFFSGKTRPPSALSSNSATSRASFSKNTNIKPWSTTTIPFPETYSGRRPSKPAEL